MIFAHPFSAVVVNKVLQPFWKTRGMTKRQESLIWLTAIISTVSPDFDLAYSLFTGASHRFFITHTFAPYILLALIIIILTFLFAKRLELTKIDYLKPSFIRTLTAIAFVGVALHLLTDLLGAPVMLLYPFSNEVFSVFDVNSFIEGQTLIPPLQYYTTPLFLAIELFWIISGSLIIYSLSRENFNIKTYIPKLLICLASSAFIILALLTIIRS